MLKDKAQQVNLLNKMGYLAYYPILQENYQVDYAFC